jgi:hypothetical protein
MSKKRVLVFSLFVAFIAIFVSSCSLLQQTSSGGGESYFPSVDGNTWFLVNNDGSSQLMTVEGTVTIGSVTAKRFYSTYFSSSYGTSTSESYFRVDSSGVYAHGSPTSPMSIGIPFLVFPLEVGKSWDIVTGTYSSKANIVAKENVTVPAGTFDCYKVKYSSYNGTVETYSYNYWFGNNAGPVKMTSGYSTFETVLQWKNF